MIPLLVLLAVVFTASWVLVLALSVLGLPLITGGFRRRPRLRALRVVTLAWAYSVGECLCVLGCLVLWLCSGAGRWLSRPWSVRAHWRLLSAFLEALLWLSGPVFGFRLVVQEPERHPEDLLTVVGDQPVLVLARHAGPGASFALVHLLLSRYGRELHVVLKDTLRLDPAIDLLLTRTGCTWITPRQGAGAPPTERIQHAAAGLSGRQALLLFPEGADWTPVRHLAAVARLHRRGLVREARAALRMPHVLPPRPAGTLAALRGAPTADVLVFTHTGHDELLDARAAWQALPLQQPLRMTWWRSPARGLTSATDDEVNDWLHHTWTDIDAWVSEQNSLTAMTQEPATGPQPY
jgi:1-acyl-sn-glycerol-3-phosphate acyltransferase